LEKIRDLGVGHDEIDYWTDKILAQGSLLQAKRRVLFTFLQEKIPEHSEKLNTKPVVYEMEYAANEINAERLKKHKDNEIAAARTLVGPHRDDFFIKYNGFDVGRFGSRGQKRATMLAMKLCEIDFINKHLDRRPVLLLDDIFSELDEEHKEAVLNIVDMQQTIVTSAEDLELNGKLEIFHL
jgi:DNA replication and repair protein RecF